MYLLLTQNSVSYFHEQQIPLRTAKKKKKCILQFQQRIQYTTDSRTNNKQKVKESEELHTFTVPESGFRSAPAAGWLLCLGLQQPLSLSMSASLAPCSLEDSAAGWDALLLLPLAFQSTVAVLSERDLLAMSDGKSTRQGK